GFPRGSTGGLLTAGFAAGGPRGIALGETLGLPARLARGTATWLPALLARGASFSLLVRLARAAAFGLIARLAGARARALAQALLQAVLGPHQFAQGLGGLVPRTRSAGDLAGLADGVAGSLEGAADGALDRGGGLGVALGETLPALLGEFLQRPGAQRLARTAQGLPGVVVGVGVAGQTLEGSVEFTRAAADLRLVLEYFLQDRKSVV